MERWFMQLNPARGRKRRQGSSSYPRTFCTVYAAQPREGTETWKTVGIKYLIYILEVYAAQPREGTETCVNVGVIS